MDNSNAAIMVSKERIVMLSVLHVITNFSAVGGAEMMLSRLIKAQPDVKHFIVSLMKINQEIYSETLEQCSYVDSLSWNGINTLKTILKLKKVIKELNPDIIQGWMYHANVMTSLSVLGLVNKPRIFWGIHHSLASPKEESIATKLSLVVSRILSANPTGIIYCANSSLHQHYKYGLNNPNTVVIPNGVSLDKFQLNPTLHDPIVIGFAGRYHTAKGYPYLFETIAKLKDQSVIFKIAGSGANLDNPDLKALFDKYLLRADQVNLLDQVSDMPAFYQSIDAFLMTSITEGFPNVLVEAMASGLPCISTDVGDSKYIVQGFGAIVPARDAQALADAILSYLEKTDKEKYVLKQKARKRVENKFSIEKVSEQYKSVWST